MEKCAAIEPGLGPALGPTASTWRWLAHPRDQERLAWTLWWVYVNDAARTAMAEDDTSAGGEPRAKRPPAWLREIVTTTWAIVADKRHLYLSGEMLHWVFKGASCLAEVLAPRRAI
jgi:predicted secreted protein